MTSVDGSRRSFGSVHALPLILCGGMSQSHTLSRQVIEPQWSTMIMTGRINPYAAAPALMKAWMDLSNAVAECGLEKPLLELVKIRASQINGCANCLNMH